MTKFVIYAKRKEVKIMININENFLKLQDSYLFSTIAKKVAEFQKNNPDKKLRNLRFKDEERNNSKNAQNARFQRWKGDCQKLKEGKSRKRKKEKGEKWTGGIRYAYPFPLPLLVRLSLSFPSLSSSPPPSSVLHPGRASLHRFSLQAAR